MYPNKITAATFPEDEDLSEKLFGNGKIPYLETEIALSHNSSR